MNKNINLHLRMTDTDMLRVTILMEYYGDSASNIIRMLLIKEITSNENLKTYFNHKLQYARFPEK